MQRPVRAIIRAPFPNPTLNEIDFDGPSGRLEGLLEEPDGTPRAAAVVCHPHPLHGGTMRNTIVFRTARALRDNGIVTLRFNFRGVEGSAGEHHGQGGPGSEEDDLAAALDLLAARWPALPLWAAGYSFGSRTACGLAGRDARIERLILLALPVGVYDCACIERVRQPAFLLFGGGDAFGTLTELAQKHGNLPANLDVDELPGADHFFRGRTPILEEKVRTWAREALEIEA